MATFGFFSVCITAFSLAQSLMSHHGSLRDCEASRSVRGIISDLLCEKSIFESTTVEVVCCWLVGGLFFKSNRILFEREKSEIPGNKPPVYVLRATAGIFIVLEC